MQDKNTTKALVAARQLNRPVTYTVGGSLRQAWPNGSTVLLHDKPAAWRMMDAGAR